MTLTGRGDAVRLVGSHVSAAAFPMFGVPPLIGRGFEPKEEAVGADAVVILSEAAWRRCFNADASLIGQLIVLDGRGRVVVGVMPSRFSQIGMPSDPQAYSGCRRRARPDDRNRLNVRDGSAGLEEDRCAAEDGEQRDRSARQGRYEVSRVHDEIVRPSSLRC